MDRLSLIVGEDLSVGAVDGDFSAVGEDPLRASVPKGHPGPNYRLGVVAAYQFDRHVSLLGAVCRALIGRGPSLVVGGRWTRQQYGVHRGQ